MKQLKVDTINYSKIYPKFKIIPYLSILFVLVYTALAFIKVFNFNGEFCSAIDLFKEGGISMIYVILPQVIVLVVFVILLVTTLKHKAFALLDLSGAVGGLFGLLAVYSIFFMSFAIAIDGAMTYVQWLILIPIVYLVLNTLINFVCCLLSGKVKLPISVLISHCVCIALFIILAIIILSTPIVNVEDQSYRLFVDGKFILFSEPFVSAGYISELIILVWAIVGLLAVVVVNLIEKISLIVGMYKMSLMCKNDYFLELTFKDEHANWKEYAQSEEGVMRLESKMLDSCREDLSIKSGVILVIVGIVLRIVKMDFVANIKNSALTVLQSLFCNISSVLDWATLFVGLTLIIITIVTKRITYNKLVDIEEKTSHNIQNNSQQK